MDNIWRSAAKIALLYMVVGTVWILASDQLLAYLINDAETISQLQTVKGWFYILATGVLLFWLIRRQLKLIDETNRRLTKALEASKSGTWHIDLRTGLDSRDALLNKMLGLPAKPSTQPLEDWFTYAHPEDAEEITSAWKRASNSESGLYEIEHRLIRKDGEVLWVYDRGQIIRDNNGQLQYAIGAVMDITGRKRIEAELGNNADRFERWKESNFIGIIQSNDKGKIIEANDTLLAMLGYSRQDLLDGMLDWKKLTPKEFIELDKKAIEEATEKGYWKPFEKEYFHKDGRRIPIMIGGSKYTDNTNEFIVFIIDLSEQKKSEQKLTEANQLLQNVINSSNDLIFVKDTELRTLLCNKAYAQAVGKAPEELYGNTDIENGWNSELVQGDPDKGIRGFEQDDKAALAGKFIHNPYDPANIDGEIRIFDTNKLPLYDIQGQVIGILGIARDSTERVQAEEKLRLSSRVFSDTHEGITITDADKVIIDVNPAFCEITGYSRDEVLGQNPRILSSGKQSPEFYQDMWQQIHEYGHWQGEVWNRKKSGEIYAELLTISELKDDNDMVVNYVGVFTDITSSKKQQERLSLMAHYDVLTGLPNRTLFTDRFTQAIAHSKRTEHQLAICFLDLDNFKPINDNYGHETGDQLLIEVAQRITVSIRDEDTVSRQGGDEFAILLNDIESFAQCEQTLQRIHHALAQPFIIDDYPHKITASSGITLYPNDDGDIDTLLRHADQAMYQAKVEGKHRYHLFNAEHDQRTIQKHHQLEVIEQALANNEFQLYYQPKVNMVTGEVFGVEALIRWLHPEKGLIPPLDFLPAIEGTELEIKVGNWVIKEAIAQLEIWHKKDIRLEISINISSRHLLLETFFTELEAALVKHPSVNSQYLQLEILESSALGDLNAITNVIETCQGALGVKVALDDFGTGYSSLTHLRSLPADTIKIDQSFVRDMLDDPSDYAIIDGIIGLSDSFNREVIAEGVETTNHGLMLLVMGCEEAQGYAIAKPMPASDFPQWFSNYTPNQKWEKCGNKYRTDKENKVKLFRLVVEQWKETFIKNITSSPDTVEHWPIMNSKRCSCGTWLKRARKEQLFEENSLKQLDKAHESLHFIAHSLHIQYQNGDMDAARKDLPEMKDAFDNLQLVLGMCE